MESGANANLARRFIEGTASIPGKWLASLPLCASVTVCLEVRGALRRRVSLFQSSRYFVGGPPWASARLTRSSPGCNISGFQPWGKIVAGHGDTDGQAPRFEVVGLIFHPDASASQWPCQTIVWFVLAVCRRRPCSPRRGTGRLTGAGVRRRSGMGRFIQRCQTIVWFVLAVCRRRPSAVSNHSLVRFDGMPPTPMLSATRDGKANGLRRSPADRNGQVYWPNPYPNFAGLQ